jgi:ABC-type transport system substrate-binding protein
LAAELATTEDPDNVPEVLIMADGLRRVGFDVRERVIPAAQAQDSQVRATFSAMQTSNTNLGEPAMINLVTEQIPGPNNRWRGGNRGGWSSPDYDRLVAVFNRTLDRGERAQLVRQLLRIYSEELPLFSLFFRAQPFAHAAALRGPANAAPESTVNWNVHEWEFR